MNVLHLAPPDFVSDPVVVDKSDDDPHDMGKYLTIQAQGFPDGPKEPAHYYTLIQPWDDIGKPSMPEFYPDAQLGVPEDGFFAFDTTSSSEYPAFKQMKGSHSSPIELIETAPVLANLWR